MSSNFCSFIFRWVLYNHAIGHIISLFQGINNITIPGMSQCLKDRILQGLNKSITRMRKK